MEKTQDYRYEYRGNYADRAVCRIRIFEEQGRPPVVVATELPENKNTSVTNMAEFLAAEIIRKHFPGRFEADEPVVWIEHSPKPKEKYMQRIVGTKEYDRVLFASWTPRMRWLGGKQRLSLGEPHWTHMEQEEVDALLGQPVDD